MLLKSIARKTGAAVLCSIHQPSSEVFDVFDEVIFMKAGEVIYQGMF
jgi:ABC-type multidrug transport system ATPase subunit